VIVNLSDGGAYACLDDNFLWLSDEQSTDGTTLRDDAFWFAPCDWTS
jgi:hypothetical protein